MFILACLLLNQLASSSQASVFNDLTTDPAIIAQAQAIKGGRLWPKMLDEWKKGVEVREEIENWIEERSLPKELALIPWVESKYAILNQRQSRNRGAGVWMLIRKTARTLGITLKPHDERMNTYVATQGALTLLSHHYSEWKDWELAVLSYHAGLGRVKKAVRRHGDDDALTLARSGVAYDRKYLDKLGVSILLFGDEL